MPMTAFEMCSSIHTVATDFTTSVNCKWSDWFVDLNQPCHIYPTQTPGSGTVY